MQRYLSLHRAKRATRIHPEKNFSCFILTENMEVFKTVTLNSFLAFESEEAYYCYNSVSKALITHTNKLFLA